MFFPYNSLLRSDLDIQTLGNMVQAFDNFLVNVSFLPSPQSLFFMYWYPIPDSCGNFWRAVSQIQLSFDVVSTLRASSWLWASPPTDALSLCSVHALPRHLQPSPTIAMTFKLCTLISNTGYVHPNLCVHLWLSPFPFPIHSFQYSSHVFTLQPSLTKFNDLGYYYIILLWKTTGGNFEKVCYFVVYIAWPQIKVTAFCVYHTHNFLCSVGSVSSFNGCGKYHANGHAWSS